MVFGGALDAPLGGERGQRFDNHLTGLFGVDHAVDLPDSSDRFALTVLVSYSLMYLARSASTSCPEALALASRGGG